jgi:hypothetical protein
VTGAQGDKVKTMNIARLAAPILAAAALAAAPALAQTFGTDKRIYPHPVASISKNPHVYATGNNVYLAWSTFSSAGNCSDVFVAVSTNNGDTFGAPVKVSSCSVPASENLQPIIAGDGANVHVFWTDDVLDGKIFYARSTNNGASFTVNPNFVSQAGYSRPTSAVVRGTEVHLAFYDNRPVTGATIAGRVYHKMSCNSGVSFGTEQEVTQFDGDVDSEHPRLAVTTITNEIFMIFRSSRNGIPFPGHTPFQVYLQRLGSTNCGTQQGNWLRPVQRLSRGSDVELAGNFAPNVFAGQSGRLLTAWWNDNAGTNLVFRHGQPNGAGFAAPVEVTGFGLNHLQWGGDSAEFTAYGMGEDALNRVHMAFQQKSSLRDPYETGQLWHRCSPTVGGAFVGKRLVNGLVSQPRAMMSNNRLHMVWMDFRHTANNQAEIYYNHVSGACAEPVGGAAPTPSVGTLDFGGNSIQTTEPLTLTLTNPGGAAISVSSIVPTAGFSVVSHNCGNISAGGSCNIVVGFTPTTIGVTNGTLAITYDSGGGSQLLNVALTGTGELSLVKHYYRAILNRDPEPGGQEFWESERARLTSLGANVNEVWFVMANYFFNSPEYIAANKSDTQFLTDVYNTFFNRAPDPGGAGFWQSQMDAGLSREGVIFWFMFSDEFRTFTQNIFGNTAARPEVDMVMDFFRGILNRFPDTPALNAFVSNLREAQCAPIAQRPGAVYKAVNDLSYFVIFGAPEYAGRNRTNTQFVSDMYNSFLRRGGDASEVGFWINQLNTFSKDRNTERVDFLNSGEFSARVNAVVNAGCLP